MFAIDEEINVFWGKYFFLLCWRRDEKINTTLILCTSSSQLGLAKRLNQEKTAKKNQLLSHFIFKTK